MPPTARASLALLDCARTRSARRSLEGCLIGTAYCSLHFASVSSWTASVAPANTPVTPEGEGTFWKIACRAGCGSFAQREGEGLRVPPVERLGGMTFGYDESCAFTPS